MSIRTIPSVNPFIKLEGASYQIGFQHGKAAEHLIKSNLKYYFYLWDKYCGMDPALVKEYARTFIEPIEEYCPYLLEEMRGIANGAKVQLLDILAINARYELLWHSTAKSEPVMNGCTSICFLSKDKVYLGQNWDYKPRLSDGCVFLMIKCEDRPVIFTHTEAGILGQKGMNSAGIGVCINALVSDQDAIHPAVPFFVIARRVLDSATFEEASRSAASPSTCISGNLLVAHRTGQAIDIEFLPAHKGFIHPQHGFLVHTNHFLEERLKVRVRDMLLSAFPDTQTRLNRTAEIINRDGKNIESMKNILRDHFNWPDSICRHNRVDLHEDMQLSTCVSLLMNISEGYIEIAWGPPCSHEYIKIETA
jgi:isopenicillin-N N-acyltransferase-like protein